MKVYYLNDEKMKVVVQTRKKGGPEWEWDYKELEPQQGGWFDIELPEGFGVYVKKWYYGVVMIDRISTQGVDRISES